MTSAKELVIQDLRAGLDAQTDKVMKHALRMTIACLRDETLSEAIDSLRADTMPEAYLVILLPVTACTLAVSDNDILTKAIMQTVSSILLSRGELAVQHAKEIAEEIANARLNN